SSRVRERRGLRSRCLPRSPRGRRTPPPSPLSSGSSVSVLSRQFARKPNFRLRTLGRLPEDRARVIDDLESPVDPGEPEDPPDRVATLDDREPLAAGPGPGLGAHDEPQPRGIHEAEAPEVEDERAGLATFRPAQLLIEREGTGEVQLAADGDPYCPLLLPGLERQGCHRHRHPTRFVAIERRGIE